MRLKQNLDFVSKVCIFLFLVCVVIAIISALKVAGVIMAIVLIGGAAYVISTVMGSV